MPISAQVTPYAQATASPITFLPLLTFELPGLAPLRVANNTVPVVSRGETFEACAFNLELPTDDADRLPQVTLNIVNADGRITEYIRTLSTAPTVKLEIVTDLTPDVVEAGIDFLRLVSCSYDAIQVSGTMQMENVLSQQFPIETYDPVTYPGLFST